jgi:membrane protein
MKLVKQTLSEYSTDEVPRRAAALAYYTVLSLAPLVIICIAIAGLFFGHDAAQRQIVEQMSSLFGEQGGKAISEVAQAGQRPAAGMLASIFGMVILIIGATGVFGELHETLNKMWEVDVKSGFLEQLKTRFFSFTMILGIGFLLLVSLVVSAALAAAGKYLGDTLPFSETLMQIFEIAISLAVITCLFTIIFKYIPQTYVAWKAAGIGGGITAVLFIVGKFLLGLYIGKATFISSYGAAGSLVAILVWVYYSAQIFFLGAEFTQVYAKKRQVQ